MSPAPPPPRVLIVDDNADLADNLAEVLGDEGYAVRTAGTCADALQRAADGGFDVALVDLHLPDGDGNGLAPRLKEHAPDGQVILLTGYATLESAVRAVRAGACAYLVKPCAMADVILAVEQAMRQVRLHAEKRELARRAHTAEKLAAVGTMTAGLSHEIRNPLNAAALQLSVLERRLARLALAPAEQARLREPLGLVKGELKRLDHILEDFLQFARPREAARAPVDLAAVAGRVLDLLASAFEGRGVRLERRLGAPAPIRGDEERLRQVLVNLCLNALEAVGDGGRVTVSCAASPPGPDDARWVELLVDDDGPGIPPDVRDRIFEPFFTTKASGSGLGLSIVHAIVTQHGGVVEARESPSGGARMVLRLPLAT